eukprot:scaffold147618_cov24-Tisochrysis_lutea.AAC.1
MEVSGDGSFVHCSILAWLYHHHCVTVLFSTIMVPLPLPLPLWHGNVAQMEVYSGGSIFIAHWWHGNTTIPLWHGAIAELSSGGSILHCSM